MRFSIDSHDIQALTRLVPPENASVSKVSFHGGNKISVTGDFKLPIAPHAGMGAKILKRLYNITPSKTITVSISTYDNPAILKMTLHKLGFRSLGFANKLIPMLIALFNNIWKKNSHLDELPEGIEWKGNAVTLEYNKMLRKYGLTLNLSEFECLDENLRLEMRIATTETSPRDVETLNVHDEY